MASSKVAILWAGGPVRGIVEVTNGALASLRGAGAKGRSGTNSFSAASKDSCRLELEVSAARIGAGADTTRVTVREKQHPFTFFLRDVCAARPIWIPEYGVAVTTVGDRRDYAEIVTAIRSHSLPTALQKLESEPEETFKNAAAQTRTLKGPIWLGLSRDIRIFEVFHDSRTEINIQPRFHGFPHPECRDTGKTESQPIHMAVTRGASCVEKVTRRLEDGFLPILHQDWEDGSVLYRLVVFASLERHSLTARNVRGTHFLAADAFSLGHMFTDEQRQQCEQIRDAELNQDEETVLYIRMEAINREPVPRYAWATSPLFGWDPKNYHFDGATGFGRTKSGAVYCINRLEGRPMPQSQMAVLLPPNGQVTFEYLVPHQPIPVARAQALAKTDFETRHCECARYWQAKLASAAQIHVPEPVVDEMVKAGLLHLDLVAYGREPNGALTPTIGVYSAIGSESSPIIQFFDSMGWAKVAERSLEFFLKKQHADGFIQNFGNYMLETGPAIWSMGEHYRYTRNESWVRRIQPNLIKGCEYMLAWRRRNMAPEFCGRGYGLMAGKVGDPDDLFHFFMLNGYGYLAMSRVAEMLRRVAPTESRRWAREAEGFKRDIRAAFYEALAKSPAVPLADGTWVPSAPPWAEGIGPISLFAEPGTWWTHGSFLCRDSLVGPLYLVFQEILEPTEPAVDFLVRQHSELMCVRNVASSQPYYARHDFAHLRRGEVKAFLQTYYNAFTGLADRETYSFWEHYFGASPHKTHEEAWFLMQTRWMLWLEDGDNLRLLQGVPRAWLENGKRIELKDVASYFGPLSLSVRSNIAAGTIEADLRCVTNRQPKSVLLRLPHPLGLKATSVTGGEYCPQTETVRVARFKNQARIIARFD